MSSHNDLIAFQHARKLARMCREISRTFPPEEAELADQLRRAGDSVAMNIGEGNAKGSNRVFRQFLETSRGSLKEIEIIIDLAEDGSLITKATADAVRALIDETGRTLYGLLRAINERIEKGEVDRFRRPGNAPRRRKAPEDDESVA